MEQGQQSKQQQGRQSQKKRKRGTHGEVFARWSFPEYGTQWMTAQWMRWAMVVGLALFIYAFVTGNVLFAVIIVLAGIIFYFQSLEKPLTITCQITEDGIQIGKRFYEYRELDRFWIIYEPPQIKQLYIEFKNVVKPRLGIPLQKQDPLRVREALLRYLPEDVEREHEPLSDGLARWFKMHH